MAEKGPPLKKLIALKRQRAEQNLLSIQQELTALMTELKRLETDLASLNGEAGGIETHILAYEHGYAQRQTWAIQACRAKIAEKEAEYARITSYNVCYTKLLRIARGPRLFSDERARLVEDGV